MKAQAFDHPAQAIAELINWLGISDTHLAGLLGVTPKSLADWKKRAPGELPPKAGRLVRLYEVVHYLQKRHPEFSSNTLKNILENGRLVIDPSDDEEGSMSLLGFIVEEPTARVWASCVDQVVEDYKPILEAAGKARESHRTVSVAR